MTILNLGCGTKTSSDAVNIDWSIYLRISRSKILRLLAGPLLSDLRRQRLDSLREKDILIHDLKKGIPYDDCSVDMVYHSHFLEHLPKESAPGFLRECRRVLKPGGIIRVVVPDFEQVSRAYLDNLEKLDQLSGASHEAEQGHDAYIGDVIEQCVRTEGAGTKEQSSLVRKVEKTGRGRCPEERRDSPMDV